MSQFRTPDFIIAGATRSGTSSLYEILKKHPDIFMPEKKELQFFYRDALYERGLSEYTKHFEGAGTVKLCGEASPPYFEKGLRLNTSGQIIYDENEDSAIRIKRDLPDIKIILTLRNPATRAHSQYWKNVWQGRESAGSFEDAIEEELNGKRTARNSGLCWLYKNHYKIHLEHWFAHFPPQQIHILILEEWSREGLGSLQQFLGLSTPLADLSSIPKTNTNRALRFRALQPLAGKLQKFRFINRLLSKPVKAPEINPETRVRLDEIFAEDKAYLEKRLGRPLKVW